MQVPNWRVIIGPLVYGEVHIFTYVEGIINPNMTQLLRTPQ